ncbi:hypothetical protein JCM1840_001574 [Sporobolomyces johnsonii]
MPPDQPATPLPPPSQPSSFDLCMTIDTNGHSDVLPSRLTTRSAPDPCADAAFAPASTARQVNLDPQRSPTLPLLSRHELDTLNSKLTSSECKQLVEHALLADDLHRSERDQYKQQLDEAKSTIARLESELSALPAFYASEARLERDRLVGENDQLTRQAQALARKLAVAEPVASTSKRRLEGAAGEGVNGQAGSANGLHDLETENKALTTDVAHLEHRLKTSEAQTARLEAELRRLRAYFLHGAPLVAVDHEVTLPSPPLAGSPSSSLKGKSRAAILGDAEAELLLHAGKTLSHVRRINRIPLDRAIHDQAEEIVKAGAGAAGSPFAPHERESSSGRFELPQRAMARRMSQQENHGLLPPLPIPPASHSHPPHHHHHHHHHPQHPPASAAEQALRHSLSPLSPPAPPLPASSSSSLPFPPSSQPRAPPPPPPARPSSIPGLDGLLQLAGAASASASASEEEERGGGGGGGDSPRVHAAKRRRVDPYAGRDEWVLLDDEHEHEHEHDAGEGEGEGEREGEGEGGAGARKREMEMDGGGVVEFPTVIASSSGHAHATSGIARALSADAGAAARASGRGGEGARPLGKALSALDVLAQASASQQEASASASSHGRGASAGVGASPKTSGKGKAGGGGAGTDPGEKKARSPYIKWNVEEDEMLLKAVIQCGCAWDSVAKLCPTRAYHQVRQRFLRGLRSGETLPQELLHLQPAVRKSVQEYEAKRKRKKHAKQASAASQPQPSPRQQQQQQLPPLQQMGMDEDGMVE